DGTVTRSIHADTLDGRDRPNTDCRPPGRGVCPWSAHGQSAYDYRERLDKLKDAYSVQTAKTAARAVLLIDDLYRSGATLEAVAGALRSDGKAGKIFALTFTRTRSNR
ncbi:MAG: hypothetical protein ACREVP_00380, partial [Burkholderiales bacterium]